MKLALIAAIALLPTSALAGGHPAAPPPPVIHSIVKAIGKVFGGGSAAGATVVGAGVGITAVAVVWCGFNQPKRNGWKDVWVDNHPNIPESRDQYTPRKDGCLTKKVAAPEKLWKNGK